MRILQNKYMVVSGALCKIQWSWLYTQTTKTRSIVAAVWDHSVPFDLKMCLIFDLLYCAADVERAILFVSKRIKPVSVHRLTKQIFLFLPAKNKLSHLFKAERSTVGCEQGEPHCPSVDILQSHSGMPAVKKKNKKNHHTRKQVEQEASQCRKITRHPWTHRDCCNVLCTHYAMQVHYQFPSWGCHSDEQLTPDTECQEMSLSHKRSLDL